MTSNLDAGHYLFTSESVTEGHPDKMCDQVSDAILDAIIADAAERKAPTPRVACEAATTTGLVLVLGEISTDGYVDFQGVVRETVRNIGYRFKSAPDVHGAYSQSAFETDGKGNHQKTSEGTQGHGYT